MNQTEARKFINHIIELILENMANILTLRYSMRIKNDQTPVTDADFFLEELIKNYVCGHLENVSFIGEESFFESQIDYAGFQVIVDPIDGTENFTSGLKEWGVSCGIWYNKEHLASFLLMPELGLKLMTGDKIKRLHSSRITGVSSGISEKLLQTMKEPGQYRIMGCATYNIYNVINGSYKRFINPEGTYVWDILPGLMLSLEQGCRVYVNEKEFQGEFLDPNRKYRVDIYAK